MSTNLKWIFPTKEWILKKEREVLGMNLTSIMKDEILKINYNNYGNLLLLKENIEQNKNASNLLIVGKIRFVEKKTNKNNIPYYWIFLDDDYTSIKIFCNNKTYLENFNNIVQDKIVLFNVSVKNQFVSFDKCMLMELIPFKKNAIFVIYLPYGKDINNICNFWTNSIIDYINNNLNFTIKSGNVQVYQRSYPYDIFIEPTTDLIKIIKEKFDIKCKVIDKNNFFKTDEESMIKLQLMAEKYEEYDNN